MEDAVPPPRRGGQAAATQGRSSTPGELLDVDCPICYQEYNHYDKSPRMLECRHVFCSECLQKIQLCPGQPADPRSTPAIPCPLCRHLTPLEAAGDNFALPCNSHAPPKLSPVAFCLPVTMVTGLATVTQRMALSPDGNARDSRFIIMPTVSLRVQQMHPDALYSTGTAPGLMGEGGVIQQNKKTLFCVQMLAVVFWVLFAIICLFGVVFGPNVFKKQL
ncbi:RING finger domain-containing protein [Brachionichthys hirsutus]|uniref:RING finger domain-containing protein n=1 Tax=Brachionichthys hirsutus TaxID=412623 RepID=UPI003605319D